jgi:hypothetical protein
LFWILSNLRITEPVIYLNFCYKIVWQHNILSLTSNETKQVLMCGQKMPLGRPGYRWEDNNKLQITERFQLPKSTIHLKGIRCEGVEWIRLAQDSVQWRAVVNTVKNLSVP